jgi:hypothetical protein
MITRIKNEHGTYSNCVEHGNNNKIQGTLKRSYPLVLKYKKNIKTESIYYLSIVRDLVFSC